MITEVTFDGLMFNVMSHEITEGFIILKVKKHRGCRVCDERTLKAVYDGEIDLSTLEEI